MHYPFTEERTFPWTEYDSAQRVWLTFDFPYEVSICPEHGTEGSNLSGFDGTSEFCEPCAEALRKQSTPPNPGAEWTRTDEWLERDLEEMERL